MRKAMTLLTVLAVLTICSCGKKQEYSATSADLATEESAAPENPKKPEQIETADRKIIKQGEIKYQTADVNKTKSFISKTIQELNGYVSKENAYDHSDRLEHRLIIRVPARNFDLLLKNISESAEKLDSKNIDMLDVTEEYIDTETRIKTQKELQNRYLALLKQATKVDEILAIEKEVGNLQTEIESVEGRMKYLNDKIAYSTLTVTYYQKVTSAFGFSSKFTDGIKDGWSVFLWFVIGLAHLWVFILIAVVSIYLFLKYRKKKSSRRKEEGIQ